jgi:hypothetical protein
MVCGNGSDRTQHPVELFGDDWMHEGLDPFIDEQKNPDAAGASASGTR